jgi:hypothetical protein
LELYLVIKTLFVFVKIVNIDAAELLQRKDGERHSIEEQQDEMEE